MYIGSNRDLIDYPTVYNYLVAFGFYDYGYQGVPYLFGSYNIELQDDTLEESDYGYQGQPYIVWSNA